MVAHRYAEEESCMPAISRFYGIVIKIYWMDHGRPHFHAIYNEDAAVLDMRTLEATAGWLPPVAWRLVREWATQHQEELLDNWELARLGRPLVAIDPME